MIANALLCVVFVQVLVSNDVAWKKLGPYNVKCRTEIETRVGRGVRSSSSSGRMSDSSGDGMRIADSADGDDEGLGPSTANGIGAPGAKDPASGHDASRGDGGGGGGAAAGGVRRSVLKFEAMLYKVCMLIYVCLNTRTFDTFHLLCANLFVCVLCTR